MVVTKQSLVAKSCIRIIRLHASSTYIKYFIKSFCCW